MNCICGYKQEKDFDSFEWDEPVRWAPDGRVTVIKHHRMPGMFVCPRCGTIKTKLNSPLRLCGDCDKTDGLCYNSNPPKAKCTVTGEFHGYGDRCNVEEGEEE